MNRHGSVLALSEDGLRWFGAHGDQERILEAEPYRFVRFCVDIVMDIAGS